MTVVWLASGLEPMFRCCRCGRQARIAATDLPAVVAIPSDIAAWCEPCARVALAEAEACPVDGEARGIAVELADRLRSVLPKEGAA